MNTPTPRTDAVVDDLDLICRGIGVHADALCCLARTLERELAESRNAEKLARVQLDNEREKVQRLVEINEFVGSAQLKAERNNLRADLDAIKAILSEEKDRAERAEAERIALVKANTELDNDYRLLHGRLVAAQAELAAEREKVQMLRNALQSLHDEQNGAPLRRRRDHWQMAMNNASSALAATEDTP